MKPSLMNSVGLLETCPDPAAKQLCQSGCLDGYTECMTACEVEDVLCKSGCTREFTVCEDNCPCGENCPLGCNGCATYECRCETMGHNHLDALDCRTDAEYRYNYCKVFSCQNAADTMSCEEECFIIYNEDIQHCPCAPYCPNGCPCDEYMCVQGTSTTSQPEVTTRPGEIISTTEAASTIPPHEHPHTNFLALNSYVEHKAMAWEWLKSEPEPTIDILEMFEFEEPLAVINSCSLTLGGVMYVLGGSTNPTQLAVVDGCGLTSVGELTEPVDGGLCTSFFDKDERAIICSPTSKSRKCLNFTPEEGFTIGPGKEYPNTEEQHHGGAIVLSEGMPMVLAGGQTLKTEILSKNKGFDRSGPGPIFGDYYWKSAAPLPGTHHREGLSAVNYYGTVYAFGGKGITGGSTDCSYYTSYHWESCKQKLSGPRYGHKSVVDSDTIIHFGGNFGGSELNVPMERWAHAVGHFEITVSNSTFDNYFSYPELFHLDEQLTCA